jgi:hypothetical protein
MNEYNDNIDDLGLALALRGLADSTNVPPVDPRREAALMAAFDAAGTRRVAVPRGRGYWSMAALATAASLLIAVVVPSPRSVTVEAQPNEFVMVPGAAALPPMESGSLVRMDMPVSMLPSLGVTPPAGHVTAVKADLIVGQDGLPRAVRLVN